VVRRDAAVVRRAVGCAVAAGAVGLRNGDVLDRDRPEGLNGGRGPRANAAGARRVAGSDLEPPPAAVALHVHRPRAPRAEPRVPRIVAKKKSGSGGGRPSRIITVL